MPPKRKNTRRTPTDGTTNKMEIEIDAPPTTTATAAATATVTGIPTANLVASRPGSPLPRPPSSAARDTSPVGRNKRRKANVFEGGSAAAPSLRETAISPTAEDFAALQHHPHQHTYHPTTTNVASIDFLMDSVVKVFCIHSEPNFSLPWQRKRQFSSSGSGFAISNRRILTNAHCVDHHTQVKVKRRGVDTKFVARVLCIGAECDIAMLAVDDDEFWSGLRPVVFGELPHLQDSVTVVGFPIGGDTVSVTQGVVSRIEVTSYVFGASELLGIQVDAAINSGNSGGPAFSAQGQCCGIAFQSLKNEDVEAISYIIPTPVVQHFLRDYETHGKYTGFPALGVEWQKMESPVMRSALGMGAGDRGVLVRRIEPTSPIAKQLRQGDVILSFDGIDVGMDGTVPFRSGERIGFSYLVSQKMSGDTAKLRILSNKEIKEVEVVLRPLYRLIPVHIDNRPPSYYILGGLVFTPVTIPLLRNEYGKEFDFDAPVKLLDAMMHKMAAKQDEQIVVLSQVLAAESNVGYEDLCNTQVLRVNGQKIDNLKDLVKIVEESNDRYLMLDLEYNQLVVLDREEAMKATEEILRQHCIAADRSVDLGPVVSTPGTGK